MSEPETQPDAQAKRPGLLSRAVFGGGKWYWMVLRLGIVIGLIVVFRYQVLAWVALGHNAAWRAATGSQENHQGDVGFLLRLREPGVRALLRMGEPAALASATDPVLVPILAELLASHAETRVRGAALEGLARIPDDRAADALVTGLRDAETTIRARAAHALADRGLPRHVPAIRAAAESETDPTVKRVLVHTADIIGYTGPDPDKPFPEDHIHKD